MVLSEYKTLRLFAMLIFSWLSLYQIADRCSDMIEDLGARVQIASMKDRQLLPLPAPENEPDKSIPPVVDRTLLSRQGDWKIAAGPSINFQLQNHLPMLVMLPVTVQGLSPPIPFDQEQPEAYSHSNSILLSHSIV